MICCAADEGTKFGSARGIRLLHLLEHEVKETERNLLVDRTNKLPRSMF